jgi:hypothetical protein
MHLIGKIFFMVILLSVVFRTAAQEDTVLHAKDSVIEVAENCMDKFINRSWKSVSRAKSRLITKTGTTISLERFMKSLGSNYASAVQEDLDKDGTSEIVVTNFTGGAHCCDEVYIFRNTGYLTYKYAARLFAGNTCITDSNFFTYDFYEQFGYFFTCFACSYSDSNDTAPESIHNIVLRYQKGKMMVVPGDQELRSTINDNLGKLGEQPYEKLTDDIAQDNGLRKEFALNLAVYYYSFGRNIIATQQLFNKYYKYPDAKKVWAAFAKQLEYMRKENDF